MGDVGSAEHEALFDEIVAAYEANQRMGRESGILEQIREENERAAELARKMQEENDRAERIAAEQRAHDERMLAEQRARDERMLAEQRARDERLHAEQLARDEAARREKEVAAIRARRATRARVLDGLQRKFEEVDSLSVLGQLPVDSEVLFNANPNDDSLPVNFINTSAEYRAWRNSPAYREFLARVDSGEEDRIDDSIEL